MSNEFFKGSITGKGDASKTTVWGDKKSGIFCEILADEIILTFEVHKNGDTFIKTNTCGRAERPKIYVDGQSVINKLHR